MCPTRWLDDIHTWHEEVEEASSNQYRNACAKPANSGVQDIHAHPVKETKKHVLNNKDMSRISASSTVLLEWHTGIAGPTVQPPCRCRLWFAALERLEPLELLAPPTTHSIGTISTSTLASGASGGVRNSSSDRTRSSSLCPIRDMRLDCRRRLD